MDRSWWTEVTTAAWTGGEKAVGRREDARRPRVLRWWPAGGAGQSGPAGPPPRAAATATPRFLRPPPLLCLGVIAGRGVAGFSRSHGSVFGAVIWR